MANAAAYHWIDSLSLTTTPRQDNLEEALAHFRRILESNGVVLAWHALEHLSAEGTRQSLHFLWGSCLNRREADRLVRNDLRAFLGLQNLGLSACQCHVGEGWFDNVGSFKTNRSLITAIKPYLHLLAADTIIDWPLELIRGASDLVAVETKPNMFPERYAKLKGGIPTLELEEAPGRPPARSSGRLIDPSISLVRSRTTLVRLPMFSGGYRPWHDSRGESSDHEDYGILSPNQD